MRRASATRPDGEFLKTHPFGDIFARDNLDWESRELATVAAMASLDGVESQLRSHIGIALDTGLTESNLQALVTVLRARIGQVQADGARSRRMGRSGRPYTSAGE